jgi:hypothetical protein
VRFLPDSWLEALLRPIAMAAADANAYVEIMAPDFRFVFVLALLVLLAGLAWFRRRSLQAGTAESGSARPVFVLLALLAMTFVPWLATAGNGRYFMFGLLVVGPVCAGLARLLPVTRAMRLTLVVLMVAMQAFAVQQSAPWRAWTLVSWKQAPYLAVDLPPDARAQPATYITLSAITYSLLAPQFHPGSHWINLHNAPAPDSGTADGRRTEAFLSKADPAHLMLLTPVVAGMLTPQRLPDARVAEVMDGQLARYRLALRRPQACRFLAAPALADIALGAKTQEERARSGFWLCTLTRLDAGATPKTSRGTRYDAVFKALESQCPRFFPAGGDAGSLTLPNGEVRSYQQAEMKAYVYDSGEVTYKYYRALNAVRVGKVDDVLAGRSRLDCDRIRGRSGLPWDREI